MKKLIQTLSRTPSGFVLWLSVPVALVLRGLAMNILNASYAASRYPVPYHVAQLSFSAERIKGWYATMIQLGTLQTYVHTQNIDFLFIASVALLHPLALLAVSRLFPLLSRGRSWLVGAALISLIAPLCDALENLVSYVMLADPTGFAPAWAWVYSSFSAVKFGGFVFAYLAFILGLGAALLQGAMARRKRAAATA
ncbi:hypothetical protein [Niveibacterium sp. SC-1]|uniref:hypothetical protein n=1 Tax=Niveibacterium sp. SC-1 TaxID=3135646 RepID=UPI00311F2F89